MNNDISIVAYIKLNTACTFTAWLLVILLNARKAMMSAVSQEWIAMCQASQPVKVSRQGSEED